MFPANLAKMFTNDYHAQASKNASEAARKFVDGQLSDEIAETARSGGNRVLLDVADIPAAYEEVMYITQQNGYNVRFQRVEGGADLVITW